MELLHGLVGFALGVDEKLRLEFRRGCSAWRELGLPANESWKGGRQDEDRGNWAQRTRWSCSEYGRRGSAALSLAPHCSESR